jgi:ABC-type amino acid transport substrate-binding protein
MLRILLVTFAGIVVCQGQTWLIHLGHSYGAHEYIDEAGYLKGFAYDLVKGVCEEAGMTCETVWDKYQNCWESPAGKHPNGGVGLHDEWYHVCMGWWQTIERIHVFNFSKEYGKTPLSHFFVAAGNPKGFDASDITGKKIGFIDGWATDEKCLARMTDSITGAFLPEGSVVHAPDSSDLADLLTSGAIDAAFCSADTMEEFVTAGTVEQITVDKSCLIGGNSAMTRKDSPFIQLWNDGFDAFKASGKYQQLCDNAPTAYPGKGTIDCVD